MKEFKSPEETIKFLKEGVIGVAISTTSHKYIKKDVSFVIFKINRISSYSSRSYYHGDLVHASILEFTKGIEIKLNIKQNDLVFWKDDDGTVDITSICYFSNNTKYEFKICILEEKDNPEDIFQKMLNIGNTSKSTFNSMELVIKNTLSL
jgi:hypothetical protein